MTVFVTKIFIRISTLIRLIFRNKITTVLFVFIMIVLVDATLFYYFEVLTGPQKNLSYIHCLYWAIITITTVGYGDIIPRTVAGYMVTILTVALGMGIFTLLTLSLAETFLSKSMRRYQGLLKVKNADIIVIGSTEVCREVIAELKLNVRNSKIVWILESQPRTIVDDIDFVVGDLSDEETLKRASIEKTKNVIICTLDDSLTIHLALLAKKLSKNAKITALAVSKRTEELLREINAYPIPLRIIGRTLASTIFEPSVAEFIEEATSARGIIDLIEVSIDENLANKTLEDVIKILENKKKRKLTPLMIVRHDNGNVKRTTIMNEKMKLYQGDKIVLLESKE